MLICFVGYKWFDREAYSSGPILGEQASGYLFTVVEFINYCSAEQIRLAPDKCMAVLNMLKPCLLMCPFVMCFSLSLVINDFFICIVTVLVLFMQLFLFVRVSRIKLCSFKWRYGEWLPCGQLFVNFKLPLNIWLPYTQTFFFSVCYQSATKLA